MCCITDRGYLSMAFVYGFSFNDNVQVTIKYIVYSDGRVKINSQYNGVPNLPQLPIFGLTFKVSADYNQLDWYECGPDENYSDRNKGARLGKFKNNVLDNLSNYLMPQESGNRTGGRRVSLTNFEGQGIRISSTKEPLECNFTPYTALELENVKSSF